LELADDAELVLGGGTGEDDLAVGGELVPLGGCEGDEFGAGEDDGARGCGVEECLLGRGMFEGGGLAAESGDGVDFGRGAGDDAALDGDGLCRQGEVAGDLSRVLVDVTDEQMQ
jgi:hypothetical protein